MADGEEFNFQIDAYTPDTMPMSRLSEYMRELAMILGEDKAVHFVRLKDGSTQLIHRVEKEAVPKVRERAAAVRRGRGPRDAVRAYHNVNRLLREDNGRAVLKEETTGAQIIDFPGCEEAQEKFEGVHQRGTVDGELIRVGGTGKSARVILFAEGQQIPHCYANRGLAKRLGARLYEHVRLNGVGRWTRDADGAWHMDSFKVESFEVLKDDRLSDVLEKLRRIKTGWKKASISELELVRHGKGG